MKTLDVKALHDGVGATINEIETTQEKITNLQKKVRGVVSLDEVLKGKTGEAIRSFFNECHQPFLVYLYQFLLEYKDTLEKLSHATDGFEPLDSGLIREEFIEGNLVSGLDKVKNVAGSLTDEANSIMDEVADIVSLKHIDPNELFERVEFGKKQGRDVVEQLHLLDSYQSDKLDKIIRDLQLMENYVNEIADKFKNGDISIENFKMKSIEELSERKQILDEIYSNNTPSDSSINRSADSGKEPTEGITGNESATVDSNENNFVEFDPYAPIDSAGDWATIGRESLAYYNTYDNVKKGLKVEKYSTKVGITKYRVHKPELIGIRRPDNKIRNTKLYEKNYIKKEAKRGNHLKVSKYVNPGSGSVQALKSRAGWIGVGINAVSNVYENKDKSITKITGDLAVDVGVGAVSIAAGGAVAATAGIFGAPVIVGAAAAFGASIVASYFFDGIKIGTDKNKKSISNHIKSGVQTIAGWFKK
ncbi:LXG domain-containing protein [Virgibacillus halodenitrificans]|uniref:LXG domain-containing protein n=1 Tax=Virgibacillus halodenitrificans TaxID=1482 RepID=UPI002DBF9997|nr:LXG domain-containing protein [Virgibacillus halodenitrificans]MEC2159607.1 LXG domain-containing protein [Virgibacillus halodenitrificans]